MTNKNLVLMAIAAGKPVNEAASFPLYTGVLSGKIISINPNKKELEAIYGHPFEKEPEYLGVDPQTGIKRLRIDLIVKTIPEKCNGVDTIVRISTWVSEATQYNADKTKVKVINPYGQTAWLTKEEYKEKRLPEGIPASMFVMEDPRPCLIGEERLSRIIQAAVNIPRVVADFSTGELIKDKASAQCRLDSLKEIFKGNFAELRSILPVMKVFKMGAGVRTTDDNRTYQDWFLDYPMKGGVRDMKFYETALKRAKDNGAYPHTDFGEAPFEFQEYKPIPTDLKKVEEVPVNVGMVDDVEEGW